MNLSIIYKIPLNDISLYIFFTFLFALVLRFLFQIIYYLYKNIKNPKLVVKKIYKKFNLFTIGYVIFIVYFILVNIYPINFMYPNETDTKYDHSFYLTSQGIDGGFGTNLGGLSRIFPLFYSTFNIQSIFDVHLFNKIVISFIFVISLFLVKRILEFFINIKKKRWSQFILFLLTILYFSLPKVLYAYWNYKVYYLSAHFFFLISFVYLLKYFKSKSSIDFLLFILASLISFQTRPEFLFFLIFLFIFHLIFYFDFSKLRFIKSIKKENLFLIINFLVVFLAGLYFLKCFLDDGFLFTNILDTFKENLSYFISTYLTNINGILIFILLPFVILSLFFIKEKRKFIITSIIFVLFFLLTNMLSFKFDYPLNSFYIALFFVIILAGSISYIIKKKGIERTIILISIILIIFFSNLYILNSENNWFTYDYMYNRLNIIQNSQSTLDAYHLISDKNYIIYTKHPDVFFRFVLKDTNNTILDIIDLKDLIMNETFETESRKKLIHTNIGNSCKPDDIAQWVNESIEFLIMYYPELHDLEYHEFIQKLNNINSEKFIKIGREQLCEIN